MAPILAGSGGSLRVVGGTGGGAGCGFFTQPICGGPGGNGGPGRIRLEASTFSLTATMTVVASQGPLGPVVLASPPSLRITSVAGVAAPASPQGRYGTPDLTLPAGFTNPVLVDSFGLAKGGKQRIAGDDKLIKGLGPKSDPKDIQKAIDAIERGIKSGEITGERAKFLRGWAKVAKRGFKVGGIVFFILNELFLDVSEAGETPEELEAFVRRQELDALIRRQEIDAREKPPLTAAE